MISEFFELEKPCPNEIKDCEQWREQYKKDLAELNPRVCKPCALNSLKAKYINIFASQGK
jgi:hypothetical protein